MAVRLDITAIPILPSLLTLILNFVYMHPLSFIYSIVLHGMYFSYCFALAMCRTGFTASRACTFRKKQGCRKVQIANKCK